MVEFKILSVIYLSSFTFVSVTLLMDMIMQAIKYIYIFEHCEADCSKNTKKKQSNSLIPAFPVYLFLPNCNTSNNSLTGRDIGHPQSLLILQPATFSQSGQCIPEYGGSNKLITTESKLQLLLTLAGHDWFDSVSLFFFWGGGGGGSGRSASLFPKQRLVIEPRGRGVFEPYIFQR